MPRLPLIVLFLALLPGCAAVPGAPAVQTPAASSAPVVVPAQVRTLAGTGSFGYAEGKPGQFYHPSSVVVVSKDEYLMLDRYNHRIRKISSGGETSTFWGDGERGNRDGASGTGRMNLAITMHRLDSGELLIADAQNHSLRSLKDGVLSTLAGGNEDFKDGPAKEAGFRWPSDIISDGSGGYYVTDRFNHAIRKIAADGTVSTLAGNGEAGYEDAKGRAARFNEPTGLSIGPDGQLYVADSKNNVIRRVTLAGEVTTWAGSGLAGSREDVRTKAEFREPSALAFGGDGTAYVVDRFNHRIRKVAPDGNVTSLAGTGQPAFKNGPGFEAAFAYPYDIAIDPSGNLLVADYGNHALRLIEPGGVRTGPVDVGVLRPAG